MQELRRDFWLGILALAIMIGVAATSYAGATRLVWRVGAERPAQPSADDLGQYLPRFHYPEKMCLPLPSAGASAAVSPAPSATCRLR